MAKAVTLKNSNNEEVYPVTDISLVNGTVGTAKISNNSITEAKIFNNAISSNKIRDGAITTDKLADDAVGWRYLGCAHTDTAVQQFDFTLPATYDNYKIIANAEMNTNIANNTWITLSALSGTTLLTYSGFIETVNGTSWSCAASSNVDYISQNTTYPYFSVQFEALCLRGRPAEYRHWMTRSVSGGGNSNGKTTRGNMHQTSNTEMTALRLRMNAANYIRSGSIYVWGMNNPTS